MRRAIWIGAETAYIATAFALGTRMLVAGIGWALLELRAARFNLSDFFWPLMDILGVAAGVVTATAIAYLRATQPDQANDAVGSRHHASARFATCLWLFYLVSYCVVDYRRYRDIVSSRLEAVAGPVFEPVEWVLRSLGLPVHEWPREE